LSLAGYRLEEGAEVSVAMTVPHFLEELYPHSMQFDIDRFRAPRNEHRKPGHTRHLDWAIIPAWALVSLKYG
jgi:cytochrome P450